MLKITVQVALATGDTAIIEADHPLHVNEALSYLQSIGALRQQPQSASGNAAEAPSAAVEADPATKEEAPAEKPKRQPRAGKASAGTAAPAAANEPTSQTPAATTTSSDKPKHKPEDVTAAVTKLANATSLQTARGVLEQFGVKRAAELKPEQYDAFVEACDAALPAQEGGEDVGDVL